MTAEHETCEQTTNLCLKLFAAIGVHDCTVQDIVIAHHVPALNMTN